MMTKKIGWLFEEIPSPPHRTSFALPARPISLFLLIFGFAFEGVAWGIYYVAKQDHNPPMAWVFIGMFMYSFAGFGLVMLGLALFSIWTISRLEVDLQKKQLSHIRCSPLRRSVQTFPFDRIQCVRVTVEPGSESPEPANCTVELQTRDSTPVGLGSAHEPDAMTLARRISQLTTAPLEVVDLRKEIGDRPAHFLAFSPGPELSSGGSRSTIPRRTAGAAARKLLSSLRGPEEDRRMREKRVRVQ